MQYLSPYKLKELIRHYSEFVTHPVSLRQIKTVKVPKEKDEFEEDDEPKTDEGDDVEVTEEKMVPRTTTPISLSLESRRMRTLKSPRMAQPRTVGGSGRLPRD